LFFSVKAVFWSGEAINLQSAVRVDLVALPDKISTNTPPPGASPVPEKEKQPEKTQEAAKTPVSEKKPEPKTAVKVPEKKKEDDAINLEATKNRQKDALARLRQQAALEEIERKAEAEAKRQKALEAVRGSAQQYKGNVLSTGNSLTGLAKLQAESYIANVHSHMRQNWSLPDYLRRRNLNAEIVVKFDAQGNILAKALVRSSGNPTFDEIALSAVQNSSPVPPPPEKFVKIASVEGFLFRFSE
jgi:colicin import membrane protein